MFRSQPVPEELQNGEGFGYIIAFRPVGMVTWTRAIISTTGVSRYVFRNDTIPPFAPFDVKVGAFNHRGEGPFSSITTVYSAEEGTTPSSRSVLKYSVISLLTTATLNNNNDQIHTCCAVIPSPPWARNANLILVIMWVDYRKSKQTLRTPCCQGGIPLIEFAWQIFLPYVSHRSL